MSAAVTAVESDYIHRVADRGSTDNGFRHASGAQGECCAGIQPVHVQSAPGYGPYASNGAHQGSCLCLNQG